MSPSKAPGPVAATAASRAASASAAARWTGDLGGALHGAELGDEQRGVGERREAVEGVGEAAALGGGQAVGVPLDAEAAAGEAELGEERAQVALGRGVAGVAPDADVGDARGEAGLQPVGGAGEQDEAAVGGQDERLEVDVAEGVVAGQPVHALLAEEQQRVEAGLGHRGEGGGLAGGELLGWEVQVGAGLNHRPRSPAASIAGRSRSRTAAAGQRAGVAQQDRAVAVDDEGLGHAVDAPVEAGAAAVVGADAGEGVAVLRRGSRAPPRARPCS